jgi:hypothetical protein
MNPKSIDDLITITETPKKYEQNQNHHKPDEAFIGMTAILITFLAAKYVFKKDITFTKVKDYTFDKLKSSYTSVKSYFK